MSIKQGVACCGLLLLLVTAQGATAAEIYKCVDHRGRASFSDRPCPEVEQGEIIELRDTQLSGDTGMHPVMASYFTLFDDLEKLASGYPGDCDGLKSALEVRRTGFLKRIDGARSLSGQYASQAHGLSDGAHAAQVKRVRQDVKKVTKKQAAAKRLLPRRCIGKRDPMLSGATLGFHKAIVDLTSR